jgi:predicted ATPase
LIDKAIARSERDEQFWFLPELLRVKGELVSSMAERRTLATVEEHFVKALDWARRQRALAWELRAATSLARVWLDQGRNSEAHDLLDGTYGRFSEGFETADLRAAKMLLDLC